MKRYDLYDSTTYNGVTAVMSQNAWGAILKDHELVPTIYDNVNVLKNGFVAIKLNKHWGVINLDGKLIVPIKYDDIELFGEYIKVTKKHLEGLISIDGKKATPCNNIYVYPFVGDYARVSTPSGWNLIDKNLSLVFENYYEQISDVYNDTLFVNDNGDCYFMDVNKNILDSVKYDSITMVSEGLYSICLSNKVGLLDKTFTEIVPLKYDSIGKFYEDSDYATVVLDGLYGVIDKEGNEIIPPKFKDINIFEDNCFAVTNDYKKVALFDCCGLQLTNYQYSAIYSYRGYYIINLRKGGSTYNGLLDKNGEILIAPKYSTIDVLVDGFVVGTQGRKGKMLYGVCDSSGTLVSDIIYDRIMSIDTSCNKAYVVSNNKSGYFYW